MQTSILNNNRVKNENGNSFQTRFVNFSGIKDGEEFFLVDICITVNQTSKCTCSRK